ncbi:hypothetical protein [Nonomuraea cavernae]|uniref:hypothetical protein n=1 Tax=Nonomuraea cavernae TaxID=2045107 RepID=UPI00166ACF97|nr:hypothetical protein [Nonomuraea cavernae]MCA2185885.1 hypothetical protein [Nonomuraea cavernae]
MMKASGLFLALIFGVLLATTYDGPATEVGGSPPAQTMPVSPSASPVPVTVPVPTVTVTRIAQPPSHDSGALSVGDGVLMMICAAAVTFALSACWVTYARRDS